MRVYATQDDLTAWGVTLESGNADILLRNASLLVYRATVTAYYRTDDDGLPTDETTAQAFSDATCAQVAFWLKLGIDPEAGAAGTAKRAPVVSKSIGGATIAYGSSAVAAGELMAASATSLCWQADEILAEAGLYHLIKVDG